MNAKQPFVANQAQVDEAAIAPLPNSRKIYVEGSRPDIQVPMREISQSDTPTGMGGERNPPIYVYDCSGPYTDPTAKIDIRAGLSALRQQWIEERGDTEVFPVFCGRRAFLHCWPTKPSFSSSTLPPPGSPTSVFPA